jgi:hypothetical protein
VRLFVLLNVRKSLVSWCCSASRWPLARPRRPAWRLASPPRPWRPLFGRPVPWPGWPTPSSSTWPGRCGSATLRRISPWIGWFTYLDYCVFKYFIYINLLDVGVQALQLDGGDLGPPSLQLPGAVPAEDFCLHCLHPAGPRGEFIQNAPSFVL